MSNLESRKQAVQEQSYHDAAERVRQQLDLHKQRKAGQGEFLGDMFGAFGASVGSGFGRALVVGAQFLIIATIGLWFVYMLWQAAN